MYDLIIIGGGVAGVIAAYNSIKYNKSVLLIDKNDILGKKWRITGKGKCNITFDGDNIDFIDNILVNKKFLYPSINTFNNKDIIDLLNKNNIKVKLEGKKFFPNSEDANEVVDFFIKKIKSSKNIEIIKGRVDDIKYNKKIKSVLLSTGDIFNTNKVLIATGGMSYPSTGSTGDGYKLAKKLGHNIIKISPALVGIKADNSNYDKLNGISIRDVNVNLIYDDKIIYKVNGDCVFTYKGLSGPAIYKLTNKMEIGKVYTIEIDLLTSYTKEKLIDELVLDLKNSNKNINNILKKYIINNISKYILNILDISSEKNIKNLSKKDIIKIAEYIKSFRVIKVRLMDIKYATITSGGIDVKQINPKTMESKILDGLYFAGEVIDVHGNTGGFNLQIAYSTGILASENALKK